MLFNSYEFIFIFLPIVLIGFYRFVNSGQRKWAVYWLLIASLFFYGWWNPKYLSLIGVSVVINYLLGILLYQQKQWSTSIRKSVLTIGLVFNLGLLFYYKYANFFISISGSFIESSFTLGNTILPLGISFFTFQQIAFLVDIFRGQKCSNFPNYALFVTFFPQLIAGPIVHYQELTSQFANSVIHKFNIKKFMIGITIFFVGLFKKLFIADRLAEYANPLFDRASNSLDITFIDSWIGVLAYTLQLYFDFSGYCDMALGLGAMLQINLPINFNSPYKANSIQDFWRRWHITLSNFLRDYLYIPLGGSRSGAIHCYKNLMITMLLGGMWHGAGWTFIFWGGIHGGLLIIHRIWHQWTKNCLWVTRSWYNLTSILLTFTCVAIAWVFFRANDIESSLRILSSMLEFNTWRIKSDILGYSETIIALFIIGIMLLFVWFFPNVQEWLGRYSLFGVQNTKQKIWQWQPNSFWAFFMGVITVLSIFSMSRTSPFLYFEF